MTCYRIGSRRDLFAFLYPISIRRKPPRSIDYVKDLMESYGFTNVYTVGDVVTTNFIKYGLMPTAAAVDEKTQRDVLVEHSFFNRVIRVKNPPGYITDEAWAAVEKAVGDRDIVIKVEGEEDMLSLAFIKLAPPKSIVTYGHYLDALVAIPVDWYRDYLLKLLNYLEEC